jgi:putative MATE family efflux protein
LDKSKRLGEERIGKLLLRFSIPAIVGMLVQAFYNIVDRIFIGNGVGPLGLAGATVVFPFMLIFMGYSMLIGIGGNSAMSIALGEKKKDFAEHIFGNAITLLVLGNVVIMIAGLMFLEPLMRLFGASKAVLPYAADYMRIILYGVIFNGLAFGLNNFIRGEGNPTIAMATMLIGAVVNTILDPIFIFYFNMGIKGAAWATITGQAVAALWIFYYYTRGKSLLKIKRVNLKLDFPVVQRIVAIGSAPFAMQIAASVMNTIMNNQLLNYGGDIAISVMGIIFSVTMIILMPMFGLNQGMQPIVGYNYGARQYSRVLRTTVLTVVVACVIASMGWILTRFFPDQIIHLFSSDNVQMKEVGRQGLKIFFMVFPLVGFQVITAAYFMAVGKPKESMFLALTRQVIFLIPMLYILPHFFGLNGVYAAAPVADSFSAFITGIFFYFEFKKLKREELIPVKA